MKEIKGGWAHIAGERVGTVVAMSILAIAAGRRKPKEVVYPIYVLSKVRNLLPLELAILKYFSILVQNVKSLG